MVGEKTVAVKWEGKDSGQAYLWWDATTEKRLGVREEWQSRWEMVAESKAYLGWMLHCSSSRQ